MYTYRDYLVPEKLPQCWCSGCGNGIVFNALVQAFAELQLDPEKIVIITGSGCLARLVSYPNTHTIKMLHGRVLAGATGLKLANPELHVFCLMGDGDGTTIGGNHLIHAARRNIDVTAILCNNFNYGMTGGQYSSTTPYMSITPTSQYGMVENCFDSASLVAAAGASYVARTTTTDVINLKKYIAEAHNKKGFGFVEVLAACTTHYGKNNKMGDPAAMMKKIDAMAIPAAKARGMAPEELEGKYTTGKLLDRDDRLDYGTEYEKMRKGLEAKYE